MDTTPARTSQYERGKIVTVDPSWASLRTSSAPAGRWTALDMQPVPTSLLRTRTHILLAFLGMLVGALLSAHLGKDLNWDLRNYHYYDGYAFLTGAWQYNIIPAQFQTWFVPTLDIGTYLLIHNFPPLVFGIVLGAFQGLAFWLVFAIAERLILIPVPWMRIMAALGCTVVSVVSPITISELGNTMADLTTAVFVLAAIFTLLVATERPEMTRSTLVLYLLAGALFGIAIGLKYTNGPFAVAAVIAFVLTARRDRVKCITLFLIGALDAFLAVAGYWLYDLWNTYGNPLMPNYNAIFRSPYEIPLSIPSQVDPPNRLVDWLFAPFFFVKLTTHFTQLPFQDLAFASIYILLLVLCVVRLLPVLNWMKTQLVQRRLAAEFPPLTLQARILLFFVIGFVLWEVEFFYYRYLSPLELLAPLVACVLIGLLIKHMWLRTLVSLTLLILLAATMSDPSWGRAVWGTTYFPVHVPALPQHTMVLMTSGDPIAFVVPSFPAATRFVRIQSNYSGLATPQFDALIQQAISTHRGPFYLVSTRTTPSTDAELLDQYGLTLDQASCTVIVNFAKLQYTTPPPGSDGSIYLCKVLRGG